MRNYSFLQPYSLTQSSTWINGIFHPFMKYFHSKINWTLNCHFAMAKKCYESSVWWSFFGKINNDFCPLSFVAAVMGVNGSPEVSTRNKFSCLVVLIWFSWHLQKNIFNKSCSKIHFVVEENSETIDQYIFDRKKMTLKASRSNPRRREKINLNFYFDTSLWCLKWFYKGLKCTGREALTRW